MVKDDQLPIIGIMPDKRCLGINNIEDNAPFLTLKSFEAAFTDSFETDAHFVCYEPKGENNQGYPRFNKPVLSKLRAKGISIVLTCMVFDYDNPGHQPWTQKVLEEWLELLVTVAVDWELAAQWSLLYTTRNGARLVYILKEPIPVDEGEGKHRWMCQEFCRRGIAMDTACSDWTRIFRLPCVTRDGEPTWEDVIFERAFQCDNRLDTLQLLSAEKSAGNEYAEIREFDEPKPEIEQATSLLKYLNPETGKEIRSEWYKNAKKRLRGRECFDCLFGQAILAEPGQRDAKIHEFVGQAISLLYYVGGTSPAHIYGLFISAVQQLEPDSQTPDWTATLWSAIGRLWVKEEAKEMAEQEQEAVEEEKKLTLVEGILKGMREWCDHPELHQSDDKKAMAWMSHRLIAKIGDNSHFIMSPNGRYLNFDLKSSQLISQIKEMGMEKIIQTTTMNEQGVVKGQHPSLICNQQSTNVKHITGSPGGPIPGCEITKIGTKDSTLDLPLYRLNEKLTPTYNKDVDEWLHVFFEDEYELACRWLGWSLAFGEGQICAMSIVGAPGVGKNLLVRGLVECLEYPRCATVTDLVSQYQYGLRHSPFLVVNEGWPTANQGLHPADQFRDIVAGEEIEVKEKFKAPVFVRNPMRVIFTANNLDVIRKLTKNRELSPEDRNALTDRLIHFDVGDKAAEWLKARGERAFTGKPGKKWIADTQGESDFVLAKHFLYLHQIRGVNKRNRFLVTGGNNKDIIFDMQTLSGSAPLVIEAIIHMLEAPHARQGLAIENSRLYVLSSEIVSYFRANMSQVTRQTLTTTSVGRSLGSLTLPGPESRVLASHKERGQIRWHELDCVILQRRAHNEGWPCSKLEQLVQEQRALGLV